MIDWKCRLCGIKLYEPNLANLRESVAIHLKERHFIESNNSDMLDIIISHGRFESWADYHH